MAAMNLCVGGVERLDVFVDLRRHVAHARDVVAGEQQLVRVDVAGLDERLRLLRAAARIGRVNEPALAMHELVKVAPRPRELLAEAVAADLEQFGADARR